MKVMHAMRARRARSGRGGLAAVGALAAVCLGLTACGGGSASTGTVGPSGNSGGKSLTPVTVQLALVPPKMIFMGFYVAQAEGFFTRNGLSVTLQGEPTGNQAVRGLAAGAGVFAAGGTDAVAAADANGGGLVAIWSYGADDLSVIASDSVKSLAGLKGQNIGITDKSGPAYSLPVLALNSVGLSADAAHYVVLGGRPALVTALASGRIQAAAFHTDDGLTLIQKDPKVHVLAQMSKAAPNWWYGAVAVKKAYAQAHPAVVTGFLTAMIQAQRWMYAHPAQTITLAEKYTLEAPSVVTSSYKIMTAAHDWVTGAGLDPAAVNFTLNAYRHDGVIPSSSTINASSTIDQSYINQVLAKLGPGS